MDIGLVPGVNLCHLIKVIYIAGTNNALSIKVLITHTVSIVPLDNWFLWFQY